MRSPSRLADGRSRSWRGTRPGSLVFTYPEAWEPLLIWMERWRAESFFPLENALKIAVDLCSALQTDCGSDMEPQFHAVTMVVSDLSAPHCRLMLWPHDPNARPADYLVCTPEVLLCIPPEDFCGLALSERRTYAAAALLRMIFLGAPPAIASGDLIERLVVQGNAAGLTPPPSLPRGLVNSLSAEWESLSGLVLRATSSRAKVRRDVSVEQLVDACLAMLGRLDYWKLVDDLVRGQLFEDARQVCEYAIWAKAQDHYWRPAFKRRLGELYLNQLHKYQQASAVFEDFIAHERETDFQMLGRTRELYGDALAAQALYDRALDAYGKAASETDNPDLYMKIAKVHRSRGNHSAALQTLHKLIQDDRNKIEALKMTAEILLDAGDPNAAHVYAGQALQAIRDKASRGTLSAYSARIATAAMQAVAAASLFDQEKYDDALSLAAEALRADPRCYRAHNVFGRHHVRSGNIVPAMRSFMASLRIKPDQPDIERWLATALIPGPTAGRTPQGGEPKVL